MIVRPKARLVAKGSSQIEGIDFQEVYFPVSQYATVRLAMSVSLKQKDKRRVLNVKNVFQSASLKKFIYVSQPDEFEQADKEDWVFVPRKALYGLRKS